MHALAIDRRQLLAGSALAAIANSLPALVWAAPVQKAPEAQLVRLLGPDSALLRLDGRLVTLNRNGSSGAWTLVELIDDSDPFVVLENFSDVYAPMLLVDGHGIRSSFGKTAESTSENISTLYFGHSWKEVTDSPTDLLGRDLLRQPGDPTYERVSGAFPPIRQTWGDTYNFLGTPQTMDKVWFLYGGRSPNFDPAVFHPPVEQVRKDGKMLDGLLGGYLPVLRFVYPEASGSYTEMLAFAPFRIVEDNLRVQPIWYRVAYVVSGRPEWIRYVDSYLPYPPRTRVDPKAFYRDLFGLQQGWDRILAGSMELNVPDERIANMARHSLIRSMMGRSAGFPKYGVVDKNYGGTEHDGFPDTFTVETETMLDWGLTDAASAYIDNYLTHFVRDDGTILYRGPETGQFGRMLTIFAMYSDRGGEAGLLLRHSKRIDAIADLLLGMRKKALELDPSDQAYGMISGWSEADAVLEPDPQRYMQPYFSNSCEAARGFRDLGRVWQRIGDAVLRARGAQLEEESKSLERDLNVAMQRSTLHVDGETVLPTIAGAKEPFHVVLQHDRSDPQYRSYRSWIEMLHSGLLSDERINQVVNYCERHHDIILGMPMAYGYQTFEMAGFLSYGHGYGLIQADRVREALLMTYSLMAHQYTRGMWMAPETRRLKKGEWDSAYCGPAQLAMPLMTRWLLAFEDPRDDTLWLGKGLPRRWLASGSTVEVKAVPTRWGRVSYRLEPAGRAINANVELPGSGIPRVKLRLRHPEERTIRTVTIDGRLMPFELHDEETISLPSGARGKVAIIARFA